MITQADRDGAIRIARARTLGRYRGTGIYPVTVGGIIIGSVRRASASAVWIACLDGSDAALTDPGRSFAGGDGSSYSKRSDAVQRLARTDFAAQAYRESAREGAQGTAEESRVREEDAARLAEVDAELEALAAKVTQEPDSSFELLLQIDPRAAKPGDRIVGLDDEWLGADGPVVAEAARPLYGGLFAVRLLSEAPAVNFLDVDGVDYFWVRRPKI